MIAKGWIDRFRVVASCLTTRQPRYAPAPRFGRGQLAKSRRPMRYTCKLAPDGCRCVHPLVRRAMAARPPRLQSVGAARHLDWGIPEAPFNSARGKGRRLWGTATSAFRGSGRPKPFMKRSGGRSRAFEIATEGLWFRRRTRGPPPVRGKSPSARPSGWCGGAVCGLHARATSAAMPCPPSA